jgi:2-keto-4-pentenoate hydratase/2-oxohepta-3-ene-1,7-dioic acid hydratase in catechol pathway
MSFIISLGGRDFAPQRIFCIGRNYAEHARELANETPRTPVVFMKPAVCLVAPGAVLQRPPYGRELHHEAEVVVMIGKEGRCIAEKQVAEYIAGVTLGLDLTLRDVQRELTRSGLPWELSKAFEQSAPLGEMVPCDAGIDLGGLEFRCLVNGVLRQHGNTRDMVFSIPTLVRFLSEHWFLRSGDMIFTGTPAGVGPLQSGDEVTVTADGIGTFSWNLA